MQTTQGRSPAPDVEGTAAGRLDPGARVDWRSAVPFLVVNAIPLLIVFTGFSRRALILLAVTFIVRQFCITGGYHRYFSHRSYSLPRLPQLLLAIGAGTAAQKGPLWWASQHRIHHRTADTAADPHTPRKGFWWSHVGWILSDRYWQTDLGAVSDFARYPELRFLDKHDWIAPWALGIACFLVGGLQGLLVGFFLSTVLLWHLTFLINSLAHVWGRRSFATSDDSRNSALLALVTLGEGWHNNHHRHPRSARIGFRWWQWDPTYYGIWTLSALRVARDVHGVPRGGRQGEVEPLSTPGWRTRSRPGRSTGPL